MPSTSRYKTHWEVQPDRVVIYPYRVFKTVAAVIAVFFAGIYFVYLRYQNYGINAQLPLAIFLVVIVLLFWGYGATHIEFDNSTGRMRKLLMGFLPVANIPFSELQGINTVSNVSGGYNYRVFRKNARYGKGIVVSSGYHKNDDENAVAFVNEAVTTIHGYLGGHRSPADNVPEYITTYKYFDQREGVYVVKNKKIGAIIIGVIFLAIGGVILTSDTNTVTSKVVIVGIMVLIAGVFINAAFTNVTFDTSAQLIQRKGPLGMLDRRYAFRDFVGIQTLRRSTNLVYTGTDVNMCFNVPEKANKQEVFAISTLRRSSDIERLVQEIHQIMRR